MACFKSPVLDISSILGSMDFSSIACGSADESVLEISYANSIDMRANLWDLETLDGNALSWN